MKKTPEQKIKLLISQIEREIEHWKYIKENGCNDPFWCDGCNMNLTRNHILYYKMQIVELCSENEIELPDIMGIPTPPEVSDHYMADLNCDRAKKFKLYRKKMSHDKVEYNEMQLVLF